MDLNAEAVEQPRDLGAAAMDHDGMDAQVLEEHHVPGEAGGKGVVDHGMAAKLDHDGLAGIALDIGQRLRQGLRRGQGAFGGSSLAHRRQT